jgi:hypothetical protein
MIRTVVFNVYSQASDIRYDETSKYTSIANTARQFIVNDDFNHVHGTA